jgi:pimeloyl-ACP methyl ester carboxylesterase
MTACSTHLVLLPGLVCTEELFAEQIASLRGEVTTCVADHTRHDDEWDGAVLAKAPNRFALCGLSMGGSIAFEMMRQAPDRSLRQTAAGGRVRARDDRSLSARHGLAPATHRLRRKRRQVDRSGGSTAEDRTPRPQLDRDDAQKIDHRACQHPFTMPMLHHACRQRLAP